jgi:hypothetical protein
VGGSKAKYDRGTETKEASPRRSNLWVTQFCSSSFSACGLDRTWGLLVMDGCRLLVCRRGPPRCMRGECALRSYCTIVQSWKLCTNCTRYTGIWAPVRTVPAVSDEIMIKAREERWWERIRRLYIYQLVPSSILSPSLRPPRGRGRFACNPLFQFV